ncbi:MAG TPA: hypothetical protein VH089_17160 [Streptosporangiaceae bacterium]|nr:hypothetical protein [Streptosporangiaceae bacterium]
MDTDLLDDDVLWELPAEERKRVKSAMMWGRPLPPRLARVAVQHAPMMQTQAWYGYWLLVVSLILGLSCALTAGLPAGVVSVVGIPLAVVAVLWLLLGVGWLRAVARARRAARDGYWPERAG